MTLICDQQVDPVEVRGICAEIQRQGIKSVAVSGCYSPIDNDIRQEELVRDIILDEIPGIKVCISKEVANVGKYLRDETIKDLALIVFRSLTKRKRYHPQRGSTRLCQSHGRRLPRINPGP